MAKVQQKISGGWRTMLGAERFFALRGYTCPPPRNNARTCSTWLPGSSTAEEPGYPFWPDHQFSHGFRAS